MRFFSQSRPTSKNRRVRTPGIDQLELRQLLSTTAGTFSTGELATSPPAIVSSESSLATSSSVWGDSYTPQITTHMRANYEVGMKFSSTVGGVVTGVRFYKTPLMDGFSHVGHLWSSNGTLLASAAFTSETQSGWQQVDFASPVAISADTTYLVTYSTGGGFVGITTNSFWTPTVNGPLQVPVNASVFGRAGMFPRAMGAGMNFWADVAFSPNPPVQNIARAAGAAAGAGVGSGITVLSTGATSGSSTGAKTALAAPPVAVDYSTPDAGPRVVNQAPAESGSFSKQI